LIESMRKAMTLSRPQRFACVLKAFLFWKRSHRSCPRHPHLLLLEALEERRLLTDGLLGGITPLPQTSQPPLPQVAIVNPIPAAGTVISVLTETTPQTPGPATPTNVQASGSGTVDSTPPNTGGSLAGIPVPAAVPQPPGVSAPLPVTSGSAPQAAGSPGTPSLLSIPGNEATAPATQTTDNQPALNPAVGVNPGAAQAALPALGVSVTATASAGSNTGTSTSTASGPTVNTSGTSGAGTTGGPQLGVDAGTAEATAGVLLGGGSDSQGQDSQTTSSDSGTGAGDTHVPPGLAKGHDKDQDSSQTSTSDLVSVAGEGSLELTGSGSAHADPAPETLPPPEESGVPEASGRVDPQRSGDRDGAMNPPGAEASSPRVAVVVPAGDNGDPAPLPPEGPDLWAGNAGVVQRAVDGEASRLEANVHDNASREVGTVVNLGPAPWQPQPVPGGANPNEIAEALAGTGTGKRWMDAVADEVAGSLRNGPLGSPEALPDGTVPLSQGEDLVSEFLPFDHQTLEAGLRRFLDKLEVSGWQLGNVPPWVWMLAATTLAMAGEVLRRRWRRGQTDLAVADETRHALRWFPNLGHTEEDA
jgi:hypothetical protein